MAFGTRLHVGNLSFEVTTADLEFFFSTVGQLDDCFIIKDRESGRSRGFAFVQFRTPEDAAQAMRSLDGVELLGRPVKLQEANQRIKK
jgi:RNA recognition motif-containing protein